MSFTLNLPPSMVAKDTQEEEVEAEDEPKKKTREDFKKMKELEEARKAGTVPAMKDEFGKDINPHIPQYIMQAPWYIGSKVPTLKHQRIPDKVLEIPSKISEEKYQPRGLKLGAVVTKFRKGACENCGAITHKKRDCLERPRKIGAKYSGQSYAPDEHIVKSSVTDNRDFDGKRDHWRNYDAEAHSQKVLSDYAKLEEAKRIIKSQKMDQMIQSGEQNDDEAGGEEEEERYADQIEMPGQKFETKQRITVRNLRIREDTAKYLLNLDVNSAHYDPKTRSMRDNPLEGTGKEMAYKGDNFVRYSGDANNMANRQLFAWQAYDKGADVHLQADPTRVELLQKKVDQRKDAAETSQKSTILEKYGGAEHLAAPPKELLLAQSENYVEYSKTGVIIKGQERAIIRSRYEEDIYFNNHTSVWGSFWRDGSWGYKCCHSLLKESYCTGDANKHAIKQADSAPTAAAAPVEEEEEEEEEEEPVKSMVQEHQEKLSAEKKSKKERRKSSSKKKHKNKESKKASKSKKHAPSSSDSDSSSSSEEEDPVSEKKVRQAMKKQEARDKMVTEIMKMDERKRPYNSMTEVKEPTEAEMEAYRRKQPKFDDPMSRFM